MARSLYGGTDAAFFTPGGTVSSRAYLDSALTTPVSDLRRVIWTAGTPSVGASLDANIVGDGYRYYEFWGPNGFNGPLWAPKAYGADGLPNLALGPLRIDPRPDLVYATGTSLIDEANSRIAQVQGVVNGTDPLGDRAYSDLKSLPLRHLARMPGTVSQWAASPLIGATGNNVITANTVYLEWFYSGDGLTIDQFDITVQTAAAGCTGRVGVYVPASTAFTLGSVYNLLAENPTTFDLSATPTSAKRQTVALTGSNRIAVPADVLYAVACSAEGGSPTVKSANATSNKSAFAPFGAKVDSSTGAALAPTFSALAFTRGAAGALPASLTFASATVCNVWGAGVGVHRAV